MALNPSDVVAMAQAFIDSIGQMSAKEREKIPTAPFAERFNTILQLAKEIAPDVDSRLWPQPIGQTEGMVKIVMASYGEIETYSRQIIQLLPRPSYS